MAYHVYISRGKDGGQGRTLKFNVAREWIDERIVAPWERGDDIVIGGEHWSPRGISVRIFQAAGVEADPPTLTEWNRITQSGTNVTDEFLRKPAGRVDATSIPEFAEDRRAVMVVHGRDLDARKAMFEFLRAIDLRPLEWAELVGAVNVGAPYIGEVLDAAFGRAQAAVVLSTPDDLTRLRDELVPEGDPDAEGELRGQARPNVFIEAGMALARFPTRTILTEVGHLRPASDVLGRHAVRLNEGPECRKDLAQRLEKSGCLVNTSGTDWLSAGDFTPLPNIQRYPTVSDPSPTALLARIDALASDLAEQKGFVLWGVAEVYNAIVRDSGVAGIPAAEVHASNRAGNRASVGRRSSMAAAEMRTHLNQLRARID